MGFFFSKLRNYFIGLQQDLNFIVFSLFFFGYCFVFMALLQFILSQFTFYKKNYSKNSKNNSASLWC